MNLDTTIEKLTPVFQSVAEKIGQGAEFGWEVVIRQQIAYGLVMIFASIICLALIFIGLKLEKSHEENENRDMYGFGWFVSGASGAGFILLASFGMLHIINPAYYALQFFINLAK